MITDFYKWVIGTALSITCLLIATKVYYHAQESNKYENILHPLTEVQLQTAPRVINGALWLLPNTNLAMLYRKNNNLYEANYNTEFGVINFDADLRINNDYPLPLNKAEGYVRRSKDTAQDPRLFTSGGQLFMVYNEKHPTTATRAMHLAALDLVKNELKVQSITPLEQNLTQNTPQKNWVPFDYQDELYFIYSFDPYIILRFNPKNSALKQVVSAPSEIQKHWRFGSIRGGTPAVYVADLQGYVSFFHSSVEMHPGEGSWEVRKSPRWRKYFMGAVLFENKPPFKIIAFTPKPLAFKDLYRATKQKYRIIFPAGFVEQGNNFIISAGIDDAQTTLLQLNKGDLQRAFLYL